MEQESKSRGITQHDAEGKFCIQIADHAAAMKAAQDAIAVEKRALLAANAALREDTERMRVMREALEDLKWASLFDPSCQAGHMPRCRCMLCTRQRADAALASTASVAAKEDA